tara:strand:+ start:121 stop:387 length:267 start_codon:yes stop_codon:yes gene_type:complete
MKLFWELIRSSIVGIIGALINLLGLFVFVDYLGVYYALSSFLAYCVNFVVLFFGDKYFTFKKHGVVFLHHLKNILLSMQLEQLLKLQD